MLVKPAEEVSSLPPSFIKSHLSVLVSRKKAPTILEKVGAIKAHNQLHSMRDFKPVPINSVNNVVKIDSFKGPAVPTKTTDDTKRLDAWLSSYASFNDGHAPERKAYLVDEFGHRTGKTAKVNLVMITNLADGDRWGDSSETKSAYLKIDKTSHKSRGKPYLSLAHSE